MANQIYDYISPGDYTYDTDKVGVSGGIVTLKEDLSNIYARYHLNEATGATVLDTSGNGRDGTPINNPSSGAGKLNNALLFNGVDQYIDCGDIAGFERNQPFSIECWINTSLSTQQIIASKMDNSSPYRGWQLMKLSTNKIAITLINDATTNILNVEGTTIVNSGTWRHIIVTYDGGSDASGINIYVDSNLETMTTLSNTLSGTIITTADCHIGARSGSLTWDGELDEVVIYDKELNQSEVTYKYNSGNGRENEKYYLDKPTIEPTDLFDPASVSSWDAFLETLGGGNQGSIGYNLYKVDKANKYYWDGGAWVTGGSSSNYNSQAVVDTNIGSFDGSPDKIGFIAYLISDGEQVIELDENQITYTINQAPLVNAGSDKSCKDNDTIAPFSDCSFSDPDGIVDHTYYKVDGEVDIWTEILQGGYGTLLEAVQAFNYQFINSGTLIVRLQVEDNEGEKSEDSLEVDVQQFQVTFNVRDTQGNHLGGIYFKPGDGVGYVEKNSPFIYGYDYNVSEYDVIIDKSGYGIYTATVPSTDHTENFTLLALIDTSTFADDMKRLLGLNHENFRVLNPVYDVLGNLTNCEIRIYENATDCENDVNPVAQYETTATYSGNVRLTYKSKKI